MVYDNCYDNDKKNIVLWVAKNDIEHITNEIVEFILITFDELKLNL